MSGTTVIRVAALGALTLLGAGCQPTDEENSSPAGTFAAPSASAEAVPTPSASPSPVTAANTAAVCAAVDKLIIAGSQEIVQDSAAATRRQLTPEQVNAQLKGNLADLADEVRGQAARAQDPQIKALIGETADRIDTGAESSSPVKWLNSTFVGIPQRLAKECRV
ncbi:hypothetical protein GA0070624_1443 [Micromonospora rhizosphaerae]|uniref:Uncharacterized protein n=1 Tax=Micromonospora rhizosphaerae TaxID=568872 RepID=A0A1C6RLM0_9ACTN|nr:hypothetical protein [Micromonospora rhizosphaerae]SCL18073.1 hypothetical protein GA0070624_1443 [Micromonospora rhizosphaerae]